MNQNCTEEEAIAGHAKAVEIAKTGKINDAWIQTNFQMKEEET